MIWFTLAIPAISLELAREKNGDLVITLAKRHNLVGQRGQACVIGG